MSNVIPITFSKGAGAQSTPAPVPGNGVPAPQTEKRGDGSTRPNLTPQQQAQWAMQWSFADYIPAVCVTLPLPRTSLDEKLAW